MKYDLRGVRATDIVNAINEYVHSERDRQILISRFCDGKTFGELADQYGLSEDALKKIVKKNDHFILHL